MREYELPCCLFVILLITRTVEESTDSSDEVEKHFDNPFYEESTSVRDHPVAKQDTTDANLPSHQENYGQNDTLLDTIGGVTVNKSSAVDDAKEKHLKNPIYQGSLEFQVDRYYERENYDCSQDDNDYAYDALDLQGSSPDRDTASKSDSGSAVREEKEEMSSICDFPVARYDAVNRPCREMEEDYDVLDHDIHVGSRGATSGFECNEERYFKNPIYDESPCSGARGLQAARYDRVIPSLQEDGEDYDTLEPESDVAIVSRDEGGFLKSPTYGGGTKPIPRPRNLPVAPVARYDTVNLPCHKDAEDYDVLERENEVNGRY